MKYAGRVDPLAERRLDVLQKLDKAETYSTRRSRLAVVALGEVEAVVMLYLALDRDLADRVRDLVPPFETGGGRQAARAAAAA